MVADHFSEVVVQSRVFLGSAESTLLEASIKREFFDVRESSAPGTFEVRYLGSGMAEQSIHVEPNGRTINRLRILKRTGVDVARQGEHKLVGRRRTEHVGEVRHELLRGCRRNHV